MKRNGEKTRGAERTPDKANKAGPRITALGVVAAVVWFGALTGGAYGLQQLDKFQEQRVAALPLQVEWVNVPEWLNSDAFRFVLEDLRANVAPQVNTGLQSADLCERVAGATAQSSWVRTVRRVSVQSDGVLRVDADFRRPLACVVSGESAFPVSYDGVRLSNRGYNLRAIEAGAAGYFLIIGTRGPTPAEGQAWNGDQLQDSLSLIAWLERHDWTKPPLSEVRGQFDRVDASLAAGERARRCLRLVTPEGAIIEWGQPPGEEGGVEASASDKFSRLTSLAKTGIPADKIVDLRGFNTVTFRSQTPAPPPEPAPPTNEGRRRR